MIKALNAQPAQRSNKTTDEVKRWFIDHGLTVSEWAIQHQFNPALVYAVLHGRRRCLRGQSHRIAVALGLKSLPHENFEPAKLSTRSDHQSFTKEPTMSP